MPGKIIPKVLLGSAGRRVYLINWFESAFQNFGMLGEVHITEADEYSASFLLAKNRHLLPRYEDALYPSKLLQLIDDLRPILFVPLNDYELATLAKHKLVEEIEKRGTIVLGLSSTKINLVHDKLAMYKLLSKNSVNTPETSLINDDSSVTRILESSSKVVIKDRYGSGSSGLSIISADEFNINREKIFASFNPIELDQIIIQKAIEGTEFGCDLVCPIFDDSSAVSMLVREKIRMRAGETDQAISRNNKEFQDLANHLYAVFKPAGILDIDVISDSAGTKYVIDINPRFGGGYPFSHVAGADLPSLFLSEILGMSHLDRKDFINYRLGIQSAKFESITC